MGVADGAVFAPPKPGSSPITAPPCPCRECAAGPGIDFNAGRRRRTSIADILRSAGVESLEQRFCRKCSKIVWAIVINMGDHYSNVCEPEGHTWRS